MKPAGAWSGHRTSSSTLRRTWTNLIHHWRGATPTVETAASRDLALLVFHREVYAASSSGSCRASGQHHICQHAGGFHLMDVVRCVGAAFKAGHHRSAHMVLSAISVRAGRQGQGLAAASRRALRDTKRSCFRGIGPLHQRRGSRSSHSNVYHGLQTHCTPEGHWYQDGRSSRVLGGFFERFTARTALIRFRKGPLRFEATWSLPASKADPPLWGPRAPVDASARRAHWQRHARRARGPAGRPQELVSQAAFFRGDPLLGSPALPNVFRGAVHQAGHHGHDRSGSGSSRPTTSVTVDWALLAGGLSPQRWPVWTHGQSSSLAVGGPKLFGLCEGRTFSHVAHVGHTCFHGATLGVQLGAVVPSQQGDV